MNQGRKYLVNKLDLTERLAYCTPTDVKYYTKTRDFTDVHVIGSELVSSSPNTHTRVYVCIIY